MKTALLYPPTCDPTAPYLSLPTLAAALRRGGFETMMVDANVEAFDHLFRKDELARHAAKLEARLAKLDKKTSLFHVEQLAYAALWAARGDARTAPGAIDDAVAVMRDKTGVRFYDPQVYAGAVATFDSAMRLLSAAHAPLTMTFTQYRTPFSLLTAEDIELDARPERNPFAGYYEEVLLPRLEAAGVSMIGVSIAFPGQVQPAYALAHLLKKRLPHATLVVGGPALTQLCQGLDDAALEEAKGPFDTVVLYEGEKAILDVARGVERGDPPQAFVRGAQTEDLAELPPPDFDGLPFEKYFSPEPVLPYDPTRGCYWGKCTFCHYGLAETGTARYRERPAAVVVEHLQAMQAKYGLRIAYLSQDAVNPKTLLKVARALKDAGAPLRWSTDMRPERSLTPELVAELKAGGALSMALGVESAAPRVLSLIDKGVPVPTIRSAIESLSSAGIGVEAMCFSDFPSETYAEAKATLRFLDGVKEHLSLFICGRFDLTKGSLVAKKPEAFGVGETWHVQGDVLKSGLFWSEKVESKTPAQKETLEQELDVLARSFWLEPYPWAGSLSTAHTLLWYERFGKDCFRELAAIEKGGVPGAATIPPLPARFDVEQIAAVSAASEADAWGTLVHERRTVSRAAYRALVDALPAAKPRPSSWHVAAGEAPQRTQAGGKRGGRRGRRGDTAPNAVRPVRGWT